MKFKPYPEYKDSSFEWIGEIPKEWDIIKIKFISDVIMGQSPKSEDYNFEGVGLPFLQGTAEFGEKSPDPVKYCNNANKFSEIGDILISVRAPVGETNISNQKFAIGRGLAALRTVEPLKSYLWYGVDVFKILFNYISSGSTYDAVSIDEVKSMVVSVPTKAEQEKITSFLDKKTSEIDLTIEKDTRLIELLKEKRTALINHVVTKGHDPTMKMKDSGVEWIGKIPEDWEVVPLTKFLESKSDYRGKTPEKVDLGVFLVTGKNIKNGKIDYELSKEYVPEDQYDMIMRRGKPKIGDLLFTTEAPLGEVANVDFSRIALAQRIIKMRGKEGILDNYFLKYYMMSETFQGHLQRLATGSTALGIKASKLFILRLILPPYSTQLEIVNNLEESILKIDQIIQKIQKNIELLEEYKKSLIHHVVTGKVDVREVAV